MEPTGRHSERSSLLLQPKKVFIAAGTASGSGGRVVVKAVSTCLATSGVPAVVSLPVGLDQASLPPGPVYKSTGAVAAVLGELFGGGSSNDQVYVGMSDRLPLVRRCGVNVMVAQNDFLYGPKSKQGTVHQRLRVAVLRRWARSSLRHADWVVVATTATKKAVVGTGLIEPGRVEVRPIPPQDVGSLRIGQAKRVERLILIGDIYAYKRLDWAIGEIDAWATAAGSSPDVLHVGRAFEGPAERALEEAATTSKNARVRLVGPLDHAATMAELRASDLLVFPSERESYGLPLAEALAMGVPVVCRDLPQFREIAGPAARYFSGLEGSLVGALKGCDEQEIRKEMARLGSERVVADGGWDVLTRPQAAEVPRVGRPG